MQKALALTLMCILASTGCAKMMGLDQLPTAEEVARANYGPMPDNYQDIVRESIVDVLKDPESLRIEFSRPPYRAYNNEAPLAFGWKVCGFYNAKNSYGGYVGKKQFYFLINSGRVVKSNFGDRYQTRMAEESCQRGM